MSSEFTYPSFRCILEYLEANKRIHICSRSKALQKIDKKIPLHIKRIDIWKDSIFVNDIEINLHYVAWIDEQGGEKVLVDGVFRTWDQVLMPGDVSMTDREFYKLPNTENLEIQNQDPVELKFIRGKIELNCFKESTANRRVPPSIPHDIAMKKVATVLFGGRTSIHVSELAIHNPLLRLPVGLNIKIRNILNIGQFNLNEIAHIIDAQSLPLKTIKITPTTSDDYYHQIVQTAETLETWPNEIRFFQEPWHREVLKLPHKHLELIVYGSAYEEIISLVQDWLDHPREHGRTLTVWDWKERMVKNLYQIRKQFDGKVAVVSGNENRSVYAKAVIIPINSTSELLISCVGKENIKLESVPIGKIQSSNSMYLKYLGVKWSLSSRFQELSEKGFIEAILSIFMFMLAIGIGFHSSYVLYQGK